MSNLPSSSALEDADAFVKEYLLWRGFHASLQAFASDAREDALLGLSSKRLVQRLASDIDGLKLEGIYAWWDDGVGPLLSKVDEEVAAVGRSLRDSTFRWYLVSCFKQQHVDLILTFFRDHWASRIGSSRYRDEWKKQWFVLPYTSSPERDRYFSVFFSPEWRATMMSSLETFLNSILTSLPPPRLIALSCATDTLEALRAEIAMLKRSSGDASGSAGSNITIKASGNRNLSAALQSTENDTFKPNPLFKESTLLGRRQGENVRVRFSPSCATVASCGKDATAIVFPASSNSSQKSPRLLCDSSAASLDWFDDALLCVGTLDHAIHMWCPTIGATRLSTIRTSIQFPCILDIAFDPSASAGSTVVVCAAPQISTLPGALQVWNTQTERLDRVLPVEPTPARFNTVRFNHNGSLLVAGGSDGMIRIFDTSARSGAIMGWPACSESGVGALCLSRSETSVFAVSTDGATVSEWSLHRVGELLNRWRLNHREGIVKGQCDVSTSGSRLGAVSNGCLSILNVNAPTEEAIVLNGISTVDFDDDRFVAGTTDGLVTMHNF